MQISLLVYFLLLVFSLPTTTGFADYSGFVTNRYRYEFWKDVGGWARDRLWPYLEEKIFNDDPSSLQNEVDPELADPGEDPLFGSKMSLAPGDSRPIHFGGILDDLPLGTRLKIEIVMDREDVDDGSELKKEESTTHMPVTGRHRRFA